MATISGFIILGCWITFLVYWIISAFGQKATAEPQRLLSALAHRIPVGFGWFLMLYPKPPPPLFPRPLTAGPCRWDVARSDKARFLPIHGLA